MKNLKNKPLSILITLAVIFLWLSQNTFADVTGFDSDKYNELYSKYWIKYEYNQETYLDDFITWEGGQKLKIPDNSQPPFNITDLSISTTEELGTYFTNTNLYLSKIDKWLTVLNEMTGYMQSFDNWWIWFIEECVTNIEYIFTTKATWNWWVYCSNSNFFKKLNETIIKVLKKADRIIKLQKDIELELIKRNFETKDLRVSWTLKVDWSTTLDDTIVDWNFTVNWTTITINSEVLEIENKSITLNKSWTHISSEWAWIEVEDWDSDWVISSILWARDALKWVMSNSLEVAWNLLVKWDATFEKKLKVTWDTNLNSLIVAWNTTLNWANTTINSDSFTTTSDIINFWDVSTTSITMWGPTTNVINKWNFTVEWNTTLNWANTTINSDSFTTTSDIINFWDVSTTSITMWGPTTNVINKWNFTVDWNTVLNKANIKDLSVSETTTLDWKTYIKWSDLIISTSNTSINSDIINLWDDNSIVKVDWDEFNLITKNIKIWWWDTTEIKIWWWDTIIKLWDNINITTWWTIVNNAWDVILDSGWGLWWASSVVDTLNSLTCLAGQVAKWNWSSWACASDSQWAWWWWTSWIWWCELVDFQYWAYTYQVLDNCSWAW